MSQPFLEEQLRRIRQMSECIVEARNRQDELAKVIECNRDRQHSNPLDDVRDFRTGTPEEPESAHDASDGPLRRRSPARRRR